MDKAYKAAAAPQHQIILAFTKARDLHLPGQPA